MPKISKTIPVILYIAIILLTIWVLYPYIKIALWAIIICISVWPFYTWWEKALQHRRKIAALSFTLLVAVIILLPLFWVLYVGINELINLGVFLSHAQENQLKISPTLAHLPWIGPHLNSLWEQYILNPDSLKSLASKLTLPYEQASEIAAIVIRQSVHFLLMLLIMFFIFLNGARLSDSFKEINKAYASSFSTYFEKSRLVIRSVLDSMIYTGIGTGIVLGIFYYIFALPYPTFFAIFTALATAIPFALLIVQVIIFLIMLVQGNLVAAISVLIIGFIISTIVDNWIRPAIIEKYVNMHFLAAVFGVLGGIEAFGFIGIYLGPVIMMLLSLLWQEIVSNAKTKNQQANPKPLT
ncbi:AI-2E family transporter [Fangia hongkongensis]|uniref:AI-2E family transporter n=1 Tax=Fangia hongkongensis TaxID=270495 RepID=UPI0003711A21|nr:AI-2E family transporter [Fangia hongkongensis]MBK2126093.1 AI-2E family transporter [Fangia hongkongensis]